jgi:hypothetical protein
VGDPAGCSGREKVINSRGDYAVRGIAVNPKIDDSHSRNIGRVEQNFLGRTRPANSLKDTLAAVW